MYLEESKKYIYSFKGPQFFVLPRVYKTSGPALGPASSLLFTLLYACFLFQVTKVQTKCFLYDNDNLPVSVVFLHAWTNA
jgi:hypothetical protein